MATGLGDRTASETPEVCVQLIDDGVRVRLDDHEGGQVGHKVVLQSQASRPLFKCCLLCLIRIRSDLDFVQKLFDICKGIELFQEVLRLTFGIHRRF